MVNMLSLISSQDSGEVLFDDENESARLLRREQEQAQRRLDQFLLTSPYCMLQNFQEGKFYCFLWTVEV